PRLPAAALAGSRRLHLPSGRRQGHGCTRGRARRRQRGDAYGARCAARLREHVGGHRAVRARAHAGQLQARPLSDVGARAGLHRRLPADACHVSLLPHWLIALVALQRLVELLISRRNTARLLANGAYEVGANHYAPIVALHAGWLAALWVAVAPSAAISWPWFAVYLALECGRAWAMLTLGRYWTTRIIQVPDAPLVRAGPFRLCRHPNYAIVCGEIAVLPLVFGQWKIALLFSILNAIALAWRIQVENAALAARPRGGAS